LPDSTAADREEDQVSRIIRVAAATAGAIAAVAATIFVPRALRRSRLDQAGSRARLVLQAAYDDAESLSVKAEDGVITLRGEVDDINDIARLEAIVRTVPGVAEVNNLLRLRLTGHVTRPQVLSA
jgi:hypothetical protein